MSIKTLARAWNAFGTRDPQWAALTDRHLSPEEFFQDGEDEVRAVLDHARAIGVAVNWERALDFGCGIGRLTQAMARRFRSCDGVDIASSMITAANRYNQHPETCRYHLNTSGDLALFPDAAFTFIYSTLVLQHMEPTHAKMYLRELVRVLAPGGLLVFQLPSHRGPDEPPVAAVRTMADRPLVASAFQADIRTTAPAMTVRAGQLLTLPVTVRNISRDLWPSLGRPDARYQIQVANRWLLADGSVLGIDEARCPLPYDLQPGAEARVLFGVNVPAANGAYVLELDIVQEDVDWFSEKGSATASVRVTVEGGQPAGSLVPRGRLAGARPFRMRHPSLYRLFKATGVRAAYWALAHLALAAIREREVWRRRHGTTMEMHCVPQDEVISLVRECGVTLVEVEPHGMDGGFQSRRYWIVNGSAPVR